MGWFEERAGLAGAVAVITGGAGGLGESIVRDLAANGVRPAVLDIDADAAEALRSDLAAAGTECLVHCGDVRDPAVLAGLFDAVDERWGRVDILVNIVGGTFRSPFVDTSPKGWDALVRTNLSHVLQACSLAVPRMREGGRGGSIVNITTIEAHWADSTGRRNTPDQEGVHGQTSRMVEGTDRPIGDDLAGCAGNSAQHRTRILEKDRGGSVLGGRG